MRLLASVYAKTVSSGIALSKQHKETMEKELYRVQSSKDGGIQQALQKQAALNIEAIKVALECLYWLIMSEMPHTSLYGSMIEAVKFWGCDQLFLFAAWG